MINDLIIRERDQWRERALKSEANFARLREYNTDLQKTITDSIYKLLDLLGQEITFVDIPELVNELIYRYQKLKSNNDALREELSDWQESARKVLAEECPSDEKHCTCVPTLKEEVDRLRAELANRNWISVNDRLPSLDYKIKQLSYGYDTPSVAHGKKLLAYNSRLGTFEIGYYTDKGWYRYDPERRDIYLIPDKDIMFWIDCPKFLSSEE